MFRSRKTNYRQTGSKTSPMLLFRSSGKSVLSKSLMLGMVFAEQRNRRGKQGLHRILISDGG